MTTDQPMNPADYETLRARLETPVPTVFVNFNDQHQEWHNPPDWADIELSPRVRYRTVRRIENMQSPTARRVAGATAWAMVPQNKRDTEAGSYAAARVKRLHRMSRAATIESVVRHCWWVCLLDSLDREDPETVPRWSHCMMIWWRHVRCRLPIVDIATAHIEWATIHTPQPTATA